MTVHTDLYSASCPAGMRSSAVACQTFLISWEEFCSCLTFSTIPHDDGLACSWPWCKLLLFRVDVRRSWVRVCNDLSLMSCLWSALITNPRSAGQVQVTTSLQQAHETIVYDDWWIKDMLSILQLHRFRCCYSAITFVLQTQTRCFTQVST